VVALAPLDTRFVEAPLDRLALLVVDPDSDVVAGSAALVEREAARADVRHDRMPLLAHQPGAEHGLVERGRAVRVVALESHVIEA
jgi:hypothetical protein